MSKNRTVENGSTNDDWETPQYVYDFLEDTYFENVEYFDPCPLKSKIDGLKIDWKQYNYINPPYNAKGKVAFITKAYEESKKGKLCIMLIPASTETKIFHEIIIPNATVILIQRRIKFKGTNSKGIYVTDKSGQSGSMFVIFGSKEKKCIKTLTLPLTKAVNDDGNN